MLHAWQQRHGTDPEEAWALADAADLVALVDLAARVGSNPVAARAAERLRDVVRDQG